MWGTASLESLDLAQVEISAVSRSSLALIRQHTILKKGPNVQLNHTPKLSLTKCWHRANSKPMKVHQSKRRKGNKSQNTILKIPHRVMAPHKCLTKGINNKCLFISTHIRLCKVLFWKIKSPCSMKVDCSLVSSEGTWQAVVTGPHQGWDCSLMCESPNSDREEVPKMSEDILHNKSKSFLRGKHEIPTDSRSL